MVVSDLITQRPIWFGGAGRAQEDPAQFFSAFGARRCAGLEVVAAAQALREVRGDDRTSLASYCKPEHKVSLGGVEGLNNTIRVIQRKAYGFRDEQYLAMKIIAHFLPALPDHAKITHTILP